MVGVAKTMRPKRDSSSEQEQHRRIMFADSALYYEFAPSRLYLLNQPYSPELTGLGPSSPKLGDAHGETRSAP
jgi:hypothetical protein